MSTKERKRPACWRRRCLVSAFGSCFLCRHSSESSPAWMQVVERRLEQAAEESSGLDYSFPRGGNDNHRKANALSSIKPENLMIIPAPPSSATACISVGMRPCRHGFPSAACSRPARSLPEKTGMRRSTTARSSANSAEPLSSPNALHPCRRALAAMTTHKPQKRFSALPKRNTGKPLSIALRNSDDKETLIKSELP